MTAAPIEPGARIASLDALRGVALLGMLIANVRQMFLPWNIASFAVPGRHGEVVASWLDWGFFDAIVDLKFITLFSLLFGASFALHTERIRGANANCQAIYLRRIGILAVLGILHGLLLYPAEVLMPYAVAGFLLYAGRGIGTANLYRIGVVLVATTIVWGFQFGSLGRVSPVITGASAAAFSVSAALLWKRSWRIALAAAALVMLAAIAALMLRWDPLAWGPGVASEHASAMRDLTAMRSPDASSWPAEFSARQLGGFRGLLHLHATQYSLLLPFFSVVLIWRTLGLFMIGAALSRSGVFTGASVSTWRRVSLVGLGIGLPLSLVATVLQSREIQGLSDWRWPEWLHVATAFPLAIGFGARVMLNEQLARRRWYYARMESAGRMALTNYVGQSLVMASLAESWGLGLYGRLSGPELTALALAVFAVLASLSHAWLRRYRMGPLEWLWRCGTYWQWLPNRGAT
jgi:uncharacterized protein